MKTSGIPDADRRQTGDESFLQRFSRRKLEARLAVEAPAAPESQADTALAADDQASTALTDADMPPLDSLTEDSDFTGFLSGKVSESLRRAALRKLFHGSAFNVIDELDDYAEDFTTFESLGNIITAEMRHRVKADEEARARREEASAQTADEDTVTTEDSEMQLAATNAPDTELPADTGTDTHIDTGAASDGTDLAELKERHDEQ